MLWFLLSISAAIFSALYYTHMKRLSKNVKQYVFAGSVYFISAVFLFTMSYIRGFPILGSDFLLYLGLTCTFETAIVYLYFKGVELTDLSLSMPMLSLVPVFLVATSFLILGENPSPLAGIGILLIVFGSYTVNMSKERNLLDPFRNIIKNRGIKYMLLMAFLVGFQSNFIKLIILNSDEFIGTAFTIFFVGLLYIGIGIKNGHGRDYINNFRSLLLAAILFTALVVSLNFALLMQNVAYVMAVSRLNILFGVILASVLLKESYAKKRLYEAVLMVVGAMLIGIG